MQQLLRTEDVAEILQLKETTVRAYIRLHQIPFCKFNGAVRFRPEDLDEWVGRSQVAPRYHTNNGGEQ